MGQADYILFNQLKTSPGANGFHLAELKHLPGFEMDYITCDQEAGHEAHAHDEVHEILVFLEGRCLFQVEETEHRVQPGSMIHVPPGISHKVSGYQAGSQVLRIKFSAGSRGR